jgi:hypothetical protein
MPDQPSGARKAFGDFARAFVDLTDDACSGRCGRGSN